MPRIDSSHRAKELAALGASKGGKARTRKMSPDERSALAAKAARARWGRSKPSFPVAYHEGGIKLLEGGVIECAVLQDGTRVVTDRGLALAFGRKNQMRRRITESGTRLPSYLSAGRLRGFISSQLFDLLTKQITFRTLAGSTRVAQLAIVLPEVCKVWLAAEEAGVLSTKQKDVALRAGWLLGKINKDGLDALVDKETGYHAVAAREEVLRALEPGIPQELMAWTRAFPDSLFREFFRFDGVPYEPGCGERIADMAMFIAQYVFGGLPARVVDDLRLSKPTPCASTRRQCEDPSPIADTGNKYLDGRIIALEATFRGSRNREDLLQRLPEVFRIKAEILEKLKAPPKIPPQDLTLRRLDLEDL